MKRKNHKSDMTKYVPWIMLTFIFHSCGLFDFSKPDIIFYPENNNILEDNSKNPYITIGGNPNHEAVIQFINLKSNDELIPCGWKWDGNKLELIPSKPFNPGRKYILKYEGQYRYSDGRVIPVLKQSEFFYKVRANDFKLTGIKPETRVLQSPKIPILITFTKEPDIKQASAYLSFEPNQDYVIMPGPDSLTAAVYLLDPEPGTQFNFMILPDLPSTEGFLLENEDEAFFKVLKKPSDLYKPDKVECARISENSITAYSNDLNNLKAGEVILLTFKTEISYQNLNSRLFIDPPVDYEISSIGNKTYTILIKNLNLIQKEIQLCISLEPYTYNKSQAIFATTFKPENMANSKVTYLNIECTGIPDITQISVDQCENTNPFPFKSTYLEFREARLVFSIKSEITFCYIDEFIQTITFRRIFPLIGATQPYMMNYNLDASGKNLSLIYSITRSATSLENYDYIFSFIENSCKKEFFLLEKAEFKEVQP